MSLFSVLVTALVAGLLGSGHCFGMCGGIAGGLGTMIRRPSDISVLWPALVFNLGRLISYALLGLIVAGLLQSAGGAIAVPEWGRTLRIITAVFILLIGLQFLLDWKGLNIIERGGAVIWKRISPLAVKASTQSGMAGRFFLGLCWGFLPCGLVYTLLLTAASTGVAWQGGLVMLAFGVGTLPAMLGMTLAAPALSSLLSDKTVRRVIGLALVLLALWTLLSPLLNGGHGHHHH